MDFRKEFHGCHEGIRAGYTESIKNHLCALSCFPGLTHRELEGLPFRNPFNDNCHSIFRLAIETDGEATSVQGSRQMFEFDLGLKNTTLWEYKKR
jgi:hypothetical protein